MKCAAMWSEGTATVRRVQAACACRSRPSPDPTALRCTLNSAYASCLRMQVAGGYNRM